MHLFIQIFSHSTDPYFLSFLKSIHPSINLSLCLFSSIYFSTIYLYIHFSTYLSIYSFLNPSIHFSTHLSIYSFLNPSINLILSQPIYPSIYLFISQPIYPSIHFSTHPSTHLSVYSFLNPSIRLFVSNILEEFSFLV